MQACGGLEGTLTLANFPLGRGPNALKHHLQPRWKNCLWWGLQNSRDYGGQKAARRKPRVGEKGWGSALVRYGTMLLQAASGLCEGVCVVSHVDTPETINKSLYSHTFKELTFFQKHPRSCGVTETTGGPRRVGWGRHRPSLRGINGGNISKEIMHIGYKRELI